jgi:hypothetical protein
MAKKEPTACFHTGRMSRFYQAYRPLCSNGLRAILARSVRWESCAAIFAFSTIVLLHARDFNSGEMVRVTVLREILFVELFEFFKAQFEPRQPGLQCES